VIPILCPTPCLFRRFFHFFFFFPVPPSPPLPEGPQDLPRPPLLFCPFGRSFVFITLVLQKHISFPQCFFFLFLYNSPSPFLTTSPKYYDPTFTKMSSSPSVKCDDLGTSSYGTLGPLLLPFFFFSFQVWHNVLGLIVGTSRVYMRLYDKRNNHSQLLLQPRPHPLPPWCFFFPPDRIAYYPFLFHPS